MSEQSYTQIHSYSDTMLEQMPICVALFDAHDLRLLAANRLFQQSLEAPWQNGLALDHPPTIWLPDAQALGILTIFQTVAESGIPYRSSEAIFPAFKRGITYWNWALQPVRDTFGRITQLLLTALDVTEQVLARNQFENENISVHLAVQAAEAERKRLEVIGVVARSVQTSLDVEHISAAAIKALCKNFDPRYVYIHTVDTAHRALRLLYIYPKSGSSHFIANLLQYIPFSSHTFPISHAHQKNEPIVIHDLQVPSALNEYALTADDPLVAGGARGYICVPLWFGDQFEGTLTATFKEPIANNGPQVQTFIGCATHIAAALAHARLHKQVVNERTRLRAILDQLPEGIIITEAVNGSVSYANEAASTILGVSLSNLVSKPINNYPQADRMIHVNGRMVFPWNFAIIRALSGETISSQETVVTRPNGKKAVILSSSAPLLSEDKIITGAVIVFQDISAQKSVEQQKNEFLSIASHELRTPITAIQGFAEILQIQLGQDQDQELNQLSVRATDIIIEQTELLSRLVDEMLDLTRIDYMQLTLHPVHANLVDLVKRSIEIQSSTSRRHSISLKLEGVAESETLMGYVDEKRFGQIVNNLISNAIKYSPDGGAIVVGLRAAADAPDEVLLWIKDTGIGIAEQELPHIFKRFHRSSNLDPAITGLGIGLYLVKELIRLHGGHIWAESIEGIGSTFYVQLPLRGIAKVESIL
jgi:PAS domain S-box-containing protein